MPTTGLRRGKVVQGYATPSNAPIYVDLDDNKIKVIPAGSGTTERDVPAAGQAFTFTVGVRAKVGGTAGWVVGAATNLPYMATMAASQTGGTLVVPIDGLKIGDIINKFKIIAQIESAGGIATIDAALRATTNVAAEPTDAAVTGMAYTQVSVTADTASAQSSAADGVEVVTSGLTYYLLITATTAAATDIILQNIEITVTRGNDN